MNIMDIAEDIPRCRICEQLMTGPSPTGMCGACVMNPLSERVFRLQYEVALARKERDRALEGTLRKCEVDMLRAQIAAMHEWCERVFPKEQR